MGVRSVGEELVSEMDGQRLGIALGDMDSVLVGRYDGNMDGKEDGDRLGASEKDGC